LKKNYALPDRITFISLSAISINLLSKSFFRAISSHDFASFAAPNFAFPMAIKQAF